MAKLEPITMPKWGMEMTEGVISEWHLSEGDPVSAGAELVDIETAKIVNTLNAPADGVLRRIVAATGETHPVGALLGVLADAETPEAEIDDFVRSYGGRADAGDSEPSEPAAAPIPEPAEAAATSAPRTSDVETSGTSSKTTREDLGSLGQGDDDSDVPATPVARRLAKQLGVNLHNLRATGRHERVTKADLEEAVTAAGGELPSPAPARTGKMASTRDDSSVRATPVARRLARELGINLWECRVSGARGRVSKADVEAAAALRDRKASPGQATRAEASAPAFTEAPLTGMRRTIANRLQQSKQTAPHYRVHIDAELDTLLDTRRRVNDANTEAKVSVNDFIVKACASALMRVPALNVQFDGETVRQYADADIAVAVALDDGLITPIIKAANTKGLIAISNEMRDLATRAKLGRLDAKEFQGGTFSVSNLGMYGIKQFDAVINPPQGAILAIGASEARPVVRDGELTVATAVTLSLSSDHRIIDGAVAARFLSVLKGYLEQPATMLG